MGTPEDAEIVSLDHLGLNLKVNRSGAWLRLRLPFPEPVETREDCKTQLVNMTRAAKSAQKKLRTQTDPVKPMEHRWGKVENKSLWRWRHLAIFPRCVRAVLC